MVLDYVHLIHEQTLIGGKIKNSHNLLCDGKSNKTLTFIIFLSSFCRLNSIVCLEIYIHKASEVVFINICNVDLKHSVFLCHLLDVCIYARSPHVTSG
jgi:hypothetical protein